MTYAVIFLRELSNILNKSNRNISEKLIEEKCQLIYNSISHLDQMLTMVNKTKCELNKARGEIEKQICQVMSSVWDMELQTKQIVSKIKENVTSSLSDILNDCEVIRPGANELKSID